MSSGAESRPESESWRQTETNEIEPTRESVREHGAYADGVRSHGEAFLTYLLLDGVDRHAPDLVGDFERAYLGHFPDRVAFAIEQVEFNNWDGTIASYLDRLGLPDGVLRWDYEELWEHLAETYRLSERFGGVHAFRR